MPASPLIRVSAFVAGIAALAALAWVAHRVVGFLGIAILGAVVAFVAFQVDLEGGGTIGDGLNTGLFAASEESRGRMGSEERSAWRAERQAAAAPIRFAKIAGLLLLLAGLAGFLLVDLGR